MTDPLTDAQIEAIAQRVKELMAQDRCDGCRCSHDTPEPMVQNSTERSFPEAALSPRLSPERPQGAMLQGGRGDPASSIERSPGGKDGIYPDLDGAVSAARRAFKALDAMTLEKRHALIAAIRSAMRANAELLGRMAWEETGLGRIEDKIKKNLLVIDKTPGPEILQPLAWTGDRGLALIERAPYGVFGVITPVTNPTSTIINNAIGLISAGNAAVFNVHPNARKVSTYQIQLINRAIIDACGPADLLTAPAEPTIESAQALMRHPGIRILLVTGGEAVVKLAMASGKRAICAGPGNPPVVVDETADIDLAGKQIVFGASFDNNIICVDEKEVFAVDRIADKLKAAMVANGAVELPSWRLKTLERVIFEKLGGPREHGVVRKEWIGQDASKILKEIGITAPDARLILVETPAEHPLVWTEQLMPVLPLVRVRSASEGIDLAVQAEHGYGHTASMFSRNIENLSHMAREVNTSIFVKNGSNLAGLGYGGEGYSSFSIASPTGEGLTNALTFTRVRRCTMVDHFRIV